MPPLRPPERDALVRAGLLDVDTPDADREALLEHLVARGATVSQLVEADRRGRLHNVGADLTLLGGETRLTAAELAARVGCTADDVVAMWVASGFPPPAPDARLFFAADVALMESYLGAVALFGDALADRFSRTFGAAVARVVDAALSMFATSIGAALAEADASGLEVAQATETAVTALDTLPTAFGLLLRHHFEDARERLGAVYRVLGATTVPMAVAFVDLVGSTALVHQLAPTALAATLADFESLVARRVNDAGGRVVKTIGDAVMFVTPEPPLAVEAALDLAQAVDAHPVLTALRAGIGYGDVVHRDGDYFGPPVNLAARAVALAEPGSVLVSEPVRDRLGPHAAVPVGPVELRGFAEPVPLFTLTRPAGG